MENNTGNDSLHPMRRSRQQLGDGETLALLCRATSGVLSLTGSDGYPYGVPLSHVYAGGRLYFHSALHGHKIDCVRHDSKASFTVICKDEVHPATFTTHFRSVVCFGTVRLVEDAREKKNALRLLGLRHSPGDATGVEREIEKELGRVAVLEFNIERITGKEAIELVRERLAADNGGK